MKKRNFSILISFLLALCVLSTILYSIGATANRGAAIVGAATILGAFSVVIAILTIDSYRDEAKTQRAYEFMDKYIDEEFKVAERYIKSRFAHDCIEMKIDFSKGLASSEGIEVDVDGSDGHPNRVFKINYLIQKVSNFYSNLGFLVAYDMIDGDIIYANLGTDLLILWNLLRPIITIHDEQRRLVREPYLEGFHRGWKHIPYQAGFAYLVANFRQSYPSDAASSLMLRDIYYLDKASSIDAPIYAGRGVPPRTGG